jgi:hypothetical protein
MAQSNMIRVDDTSHRALPRAVATSLQTQFDLAHQDTNRSK